jgi:hypothetical protein
LTGRTLRIRISDRGTNEKSLASTVLAQNWFKGSLDQAVTKAKAENKLVLIDFYSYT